MGINSIFKNIILVFVFCLIIMVLPANAQNIRIVHFSDVHLDTHAADKPVRKFAQSSKMFQKAIEKTNTINPDIVVFSGDMVNRSKEDDFSKFLLLANNLKTQYYPVFGNHDVGVGGGLSKQKLLQMINQNCSWQNLEKPYYSIVMGEYVFIFADGTTDKIISANGFFTDEVLNFIDKTLSENFDKKAIIIQHFPMMPPFKSVTHEIFNVQKYFNVIDKHENLILVLSGHYHASKAIQRKNVLFVSTPSLIEYPHAFRSLEISSQKDKILIKSKLYPDEEQNALENASTNENNLKLGENSDNFFEITLENKISPPIHKISFWEKLSSWFKELTAFFIFL